MPVLLLAKTGRTAVSATAHRKQTRIQFTWIHRRHRHLSTGTTTTAAFQVRNSIPNSCVERLLGPGAFRRLPVSANALATRTLQVVLFEVVCVIGLLFATVQESFGCLSHAGDARITYADGTVGLMRDLSIGGKASPTRNLHPVQHT